MKLFKTLKRAESARDRLMRAEGAILLFDKFCQIQVEPHGEVYRISRQYTGKPIQHLNRQNRFAIGGKSRRPGRPAGRYVIVKLCPVNQIRRCPAPLAAPAGSAGGVVQVADHANLVLSEQCSMRYQTRRESVC